MSRTQRGYTLLELAMTLSLVGLLMGTGVYSFRKANAREEIDGWARSVVYDIAAGQQAAITRRTTVTLTFQNGLYSIAAGTAIFRQQTLPNGMTFGSMLQTVTFDRRGTPSGALTLTLSSTASGRSYTVTIESATGRVTLSES